MTDRKLARSGAAQRFTDLAIGTHVFMVRSGGSGLNAAGTNHIHIMAESTGGTVDIDYTYDPGHEEDLSDLVAAPATDFLAAVNSQTWAAGATASAVERIVGPVTAVKVTIATAAVNKVTIAH